jgi:hypothetical protein
MAVFVTATCIILRPALVATWLAESPLKVVTDAHPSVVAQPTGDAAHNDPAVGLKRFLARWEMNDFLFLIVIENLKTADAVRAGQKAWFSIYPENVRESIVSSVTACIEVDRWGAAFLVARGVTLAYYALVFVWLLQRCWRATAPTVWAESVFLALAWFWLLSPTLNPWYWTWVLPFLALARSRVWLAMSGCVLLYYLRFWLIYQFPQTPVLDTPYAGAPFFDLVVTWIEFGPWFVCLWLGWLRTRTC